MTDRELKHELRQSLAVIALTGAVIDRRPVRDPGVRRWIEQVRGEAERMDRLLGEAEEVAVPVDAGTLVTKVWQSVAGRSAVAMRLSRGVGCWVLALPAALERCVRDLVEDAVRAAGPHDEVIVEVARCGAFVAIEVGDSGGGLEGDTDRPLSGVQAASGFAADHGGVVVLVPSQLGGASVRLVLPGTSVTGLDERGEPA